MERIYLVMKLIFASLN